MNKKYIEVKIPILDDIEEMEVIKTFNEQQLWYVCAIAKAFENKENENTNLKQALNEIKEICENNAIEVNTREYGNLVVTNIDDILQIIDKVGGNE